jgi:thiaminase
VRFQYANPPRTKEEFQAAIDEAYAQADSILTVSEELIAEARRWYDRAYTLEMEFFESGW